MRQNPKSGPASPIKSGSSIAAIPDSAEMTERAIELDEIHRGSLLCAIDEIAIRA